MISIERYLRDLETVFPRQVRELRYLGGTLRNMRRLGIQEDDLWDLLQDSTLLLLKGKRLRYGCRLIADYFRLRADEPALGLGATPVREPAATEDD